MPSRDQSWVSASQALAGVSDPEVLKKLSEWKTACDRLDDRLAVLAKTPAKPAPTKPVPSQRRATVERLVSARGTNWSCYEDGRRHVAPTAAYLKRVQVIRLPITWDYQAAEIHAVLDVADSVPGVIVVVECHSYGRVGNTRNAQGIATGPLATAAQISEHSVAIYREFGRHPSFCLGLDNEPMQAASEWEACTQAAATALDKAGYTGPLIVPGALASNVGAWPDRHPRPWIGPLFGITPVYEGHHYPEGQEERTGQTLEQLDAYGRGRGFADYAAFIRAWFTWGLLGSAAWRGVPLIIGETAFTHPQHLALYLSLAQARGIGVVVWADGVWNADYGYRVTEDDLAALDRARS